MPYTFPAVEGTQKATTFYLTTMEYGEVATLVVLPEEFLGKSLLDEHMMQRKLSWARVRKEMKKYLLDFGDSFYSALTLFIVPRDLTPLKEGEGYEFKPSAPESKHGILELRSTIVLFPGDGQHRAASIKEALKEDSSLASVEIPIVLIPFEHRAKVRQLFSDLNLNAKPVNRTIGLDFETRDPVAIIAKRVADEVPLFKDRTNRRTNSLPSSSGHVITLNALYGGSVLLLEALLGAEKFDQTLLDLSRSKETDDEMGRVAKRLASVWEVAIASLPEWKGVESGKTEPGKIRDGYVFAHALGWQAIAHAAAAIIKTHPKGWEEKLQAALGSVNWERSNPDWQGVAMVGTRVNNTGPAVRATAGYILEQANVGGEHAEPYLTALASSRPGNGQKQGKKEKALV